MSVIAVLLSLALATQEAGVHEGPPGPVPPLVSGAVRFDPAAMTASTGAVGRNGILALGPATHARTGRVQRGFRVGPAAGFAVEAGAEWHFVEVEQVDGRSARSRYRFWCGPAQAISMFGREPTTGCMAQAAPGVWSYFPGKGEPWLAGWAWPTRAANMSTDAFEIVDSPTSGIDPFDVALVVRDFNSRRVRLEAQGRRGDQSVVFWRGEADWREGQAVVPLWTHRLTLRLEGDGVTAALTADGDGAPLPPTSPL